MITGKTLSSHRALYSRHGYATPARTAPAARWLQATAFTFIAATGCSGKQTGDEGHERETSASEYVENAGTPSETPPDSFPSGPQLRPYCLYQLHWAPPDRQEHYACHWEGESTAWNYGDPTPAGAYWCECSDAGYVDVTSAEDCEAALRQGCDIELKGPSPCNRDGAVCWPVKGKPGSWGCSCSGDAQNLTLQETEKCEQALYDECSAPTCTNAAGSCEKMEDAVGYECTCQDGSNASWQDNTNCEAVLHASCTPQCSGAAGSCSLRYDGFDCTCGGDAESDVVRFVSNDAAYGVCPLALELACGPPPEGEQCVEEDEHATVVCTADGEGDWDCGCDRRVESESAPAEESAEPPGAEPASAEPSTTPPPTTPTDSEAVGVPLADQVTSPGATIGSGSVTQAPHPAPPAEVRARRFECYDAVWEACD